MRTRITVNFDSKREARAVADALAPDNVDASKQVRVKTVVRGKAVEASVNCRGRLETFIATIDDLLSCMLAAEKTLHAVRGEVK